MNLCLNLALSWVGKRVFVPPTAPTAVSFQSLTANGTSGTVSTTQLTATFDVDPGLTTANFVVTGASKGVVSKVGAVYTVNISDITVADGESVTLTVSNPTGFSITPLFRTVSVNVASDLILKTYESEYSPEWENLFSLPEQDAQGRSIYTPSADSIIMYVTADGNDSTAVNYGPTAFADFENPVAPAAYLTIEAACAEMRPNMPDFVLIRGGDAFELTSTIDRVIGKSAMEKSVVRGYGPSGRPQILLNSSATTAFRHWNTDSYAAYLNLEFYDPRRDPDSPEWLGAGVNYNSYAFSINAFGDDLTGIHLEGIKTNYVGLGGTAVEYLVGSVTDVILRDITVNNAWSATESHTQGCFLDSGSYLIEDVVFNHNGWIEDDEWPDNANQFKHNLYISNAYETIIKGCIDYKPSSMGLKLTANPYSFTVLTAMSSATQTTLVTKQTPNVHFPSTGTFNVVRDGGSNQLVTFTNRVGNVFTIDPIDFSADPASVGNAVKQTQNYITSYDVSIYDNYFGDNEIAVSYGGNDDLGDTSPRWKNVRVQGNVVSELGLSNQTGRGIGWGFGCFDNEGSITSENLIAPTTNPAVTNTYASEVGGYTVDVSVFNNIALIGDFDGNANISYSNAELLESSDFVNYGANILSYLVANGQTGSYDNFASLLESVEWGNRPAYLTATAINNYYRRQYALATPFKIITQTTNQSVIVGDVATFTFDVIANTRVTWQWYDAADDSEIFGATGYQYQFTVTEDDDGRQLYGKAFDELGNEITGNTVTFTVASTNKILSPDDFNSTDWTKTAVTITPNSTLAPDGTLTADTITETTASTEHLVSQVIPTTGSSEVISFYAKYIDCPYIGFRTRTDTWRNFVFNIQTGEVFSGAQTGATDLQITPADNGFYRISMRLTRATTNVQINMFSSDGLAQSYTGTGRSAYIWGAMLTDGDELTPYIAG
tara:strand:+ start:36861 stop:39698 length:2838 start_codon:yes stop_codon:yes gene_type:complete